MCFPLLKLQASIKHPSPFGLPFCTASNTETDEL